MSVYDNIAYPLESQKVKKAEIRERVTKTAELLGLTEHLKRRPRNLSGGQRQRVAMGRALVRQPQVFLMDEPLSNLDAKLRVQMRAEITRLQDQLGVTTIFVTHDQVEAMTMGDRIVVMRKGVLQQQGPPELLYRRAGQSLRRRVHRLARDEPLPGPVRRRRGLARRASASRCRLACFGERPGLAAYRGRELAVGVRPEHLDRHSDSRPDAATAARARSGSPRHCRPNGSSTRRSQAQPVVTDDVIEIAQDVDDAAVERLEEFAEDHFVLACSRFDIGSPEPAARALRVRGRSPAACTSSTWAPVRRSAEPRRAVQNMG